MRNPIVASIDDVLQLSSLKDRKPEDNCEWGMWTNSIQKYVFRKGKDAAGNIVFMEYNDIPSADGNLDDVRKRDHGAEWNGGKPFIWYLERCALYGVAALS